MHRLVPPERVREAAERIAGHIHRTPVLTSTALGAAAGTDVLHLKCESFQKTGSFKVRGALNRILTLDSETRRRGVVTISAGNHAQAVAWAASTLSIPSTVVMPSGASPTKVRASEAYGAEVIDGGPVAEAFELAHHLAESRGLVFLHPFDEPMVIAGQGTVGLELVEQVADVRTVVVPIGGGGQIAGICAGLGALRPGVSIYGVEPEGAAAMRLSLDRGEASRLQSVDTIADGLAPPMAGTLTFEHVRARVRDVVTVTDAEIARAMRLLFERTKLVVEPSGAAGVAALIERKVRPGDGPTVAIVTGGNVDLDRLPELLTLG